MKWPVDIIEKIAKRKVVLFLGAGVSANAISEKGDKRPPTWEQFLNKGISEVTDENIVEYVRKLLNESSAVRQARGISMRWRLDLIVQLGCGHWPLP